MSKDRFRHIQRNTITELEDRTSDVEYSITETVALMVACLNHHYRDYSVYFALLNAPGLDLRAHPPYPRNSIFVFHQHGGLWSTAWIDWTENKIVTFDGVSSTPNMINDDPHRKERLEKLKTVVTQHRDLFVMNIPQWQQDPTFSHELGGQSGSFCLAWAEANYNRWPVREVDRWKDGYRKVWIPHASEELPWVRVLEDHQIPWPNVCFWSV
ncbi:hypothetical protein VTK26DRAFT_9082 [Humicola hyalothermophila]